MKITDILYGAYLVDDVIDALIQSKPIQRLKGIHQGGASYLVNASWNNTRYDHSVGVMLLIKRLGGSVEEQVAGLLHDVSHTAFSHVIDYAVENRSENVHELIFDEIVNQSEIPSILELYGYSPKEILSSFGKWRLLEQPAPLLCADRIDYTLRDMYTYGQISLTEVNDFLDSLIIQDGMICLQSLSAAEWFVKTYYKEVIDFFMDPRNVYANEMMAKTIQLSLENGVLQFADLLETDAKVLERLRTSTNEKVQNMIAQITPSVQVVEQAKNYDLYQQPKTRLIDPIIYQNERTIRASKLSASIKEMNEQAYKRAKRGVYLKIMNEESGWSDALSNGTL
ncbi:HD domain-containing protein [Virgibacillus sp. LDC-1]|uniref:HD domain-containing protein n=1 Tax=Virgibacillus sp. LDC-1 TaxID=3039856 RepID=UPI0024DE603F|nr:HD domain-containing protein [Virgibacillus sp. LDC-1]